MITEQNKINFKVINFDLISKKYYKAKSFKLINSTMNDIILVLGIILSYKIFVIKII